MKSERRKAWAELPPELHEALGSLRDVPEPNKKEWAARRSVFLQEARATAAHLPAPATRTLRERLTAALSGRASQARTPAPALARVLLILVLIAGGTVGTVAAAQHSLPGSLLYPAKLQIEDWRLALTHHPEDEAQLAMAMAQERVEEAMALAHQAEQVPEEVAERYQRQLAMALQATGEITGPVRTALQTQFYHAVTQQMQATEAVMEQHRAGEVGTTPDAIQAMIRTMEMATLQIGYPDAASGEEDEGIVPGKQALCTDWRGVWNPDCMVIPTSTPGAGSADCTCTPGLACACDVSETNGNAGQGTQPPGSPGNGPGSSGSGSSDDPGAGTLSPDQGSGGQDGKP